MTLYVEQADFHDVPDDSSLDRRTNAADNQQDAGASSSYRSLGGESSTSAQSSARHDSSSTDNDPCSSITPIPIPPGESPALASVPNRRSSLPSNRSKSEEHLYSVAFRATSSIAVDTERIIAENLESTKTITQLKLQLAEALSMLGNLQHSNQILDKKLRGAKDEAYAHSALHQKEVSSLREELNKTKKERDDLTGELRHMHEERDDARREVTRMKMLSFKQEQRRLSSETTESTMSIASSMGSVTGGGGGRRGSRGSMLQNFRESSRNLLGGGGSGQGTGNDAASAANAPAENRRSSLTVADLHNSRRNLMLNQQGNLATGESFGRRGSATTNSASLALALANANTSSNGGCISSSLPKHSSTTNVQDPRNSEIRSSGGGQWLRRLSNLGGVGGITTRGSSYDASFDNSQNSFSSVLGIDRELNKLEEQQSSGGSSNLILPGRGASPLTSPNVIPRGGTCDDNDDDDDDDDGLGQSDEEAIRNAAGVFACHGGMPCQDRVVNQSPDNHNSQEFEDEEDDPRNYLSSQVYAVGWTSRRKLLAEDEEKNPSTASDGKFALGEEMVRRNSLTARRA